MTFFMRRSSPNRLAVGCGVAYLLCFLFLPFYNLAFVLRVRGTMLMTLAPGTVLMLLPGLFMSLSGLFFDKKTGMGISGAAFVMTLSVLVCGASVLPVNEGLRIAGNASGTAINALPSLSVSMGAGGILCLLSCIADFVAKLLLDTGASYAHDDPADRPNDDFYS